VTAVGARIEERLRISLGRGHDRIHRTVAALLERRAVTGTLVDAGCGAGDLWRATGGRFGRCIGIDAARHPQLPEDVAFHQTDLHGPRLPLADGVADATAAVAMRGLARVTKRRGWVVVTTPNQLSALSLLTLLATGRFSAFQEADDPAHRTALLEIDLRRIAAESGLEDIAIEFTRWGRLPLSGWHYPGPVAALYPRRLSDNVAMIGRRCA
jgi:hypothetical protein